jgi:hypothetical protein
MAKSNIDKLMELKQLYEQGILTKEEMESEKAKILNAPTPKVESPNNEIPPVEDAESSFASTSEEENHGRNNKVIIGIAAAIVVAIVVIVALYHNKNNEPKEVAADDVELAQLTDEAKQDSQEETEDFYKECISLEQVFAVKDNKTSDKLVNLLKSLNYVHKESEDDVNSGDWEKSIIIDGVSSKVKVSWEVGRHTLYRLNMECTEDTIVKRWLSEMKSLGYKVNAIKSDYTEGWDGEKTVNNNPDWVSIFHDKEGKKYSLTAKTGFSAAYGTYEEAEKKAAQKEQEEIKEIESQAISIETVIDAYKNNVDGRADNIFFKKEKVYQFYLNKIRKSSSDYEYVMEGSGSSHGDIADILVYTDDSRLANLNFPLKLCFRGALVSISRPEHGSWFIYHFVCTEALTYRN